MVVSDLAINSALTRWLSAVRKNFSFSPTCACMYVYYTAWTRGFSLTPWSGASAVVFILLLRLVGVS